MKPYQERVITEKAELDVKREALDAFIDSDVFNTLDYGDQQLLVGTSRCYDYILMRADATHT